MAIGESVMVEMGNVWDRTTAFIDDHARAVLPIALLGIWLPSAATNVVGWAAQGCDPVIAPWPAAILAVALAIATIWAQLAIAALVLKPEGGARPAGARGGAALVRAVAAMVLIFAALAVALAPLVLGIFASSRSVMVDGCNMVGRYAAVPWYVPVYVLAFVIVAVFVAVRLTMLYPVLVAEGGVVSAIRRAFAVSRGMFWRLFGVWLVFVLVYGIASLAASSAFGLIARLLAPNAGPFGAGAIVVALLVAGVRTAFTVIVATFAALLYRAVTGGDALELDREAMRPAAAPAPPAADIPTA